MENECWGHLVLIKAEVSASFFEKKEPGRRAAKKLSVLRAEATGWLGFTGPWRVGKGVDGPVNPGHDVWTGRRANAMKYEKLSMLLAE